VDGEASGPVDWISFGPYLAFPTERTLKRDGRPIAIGDKPFDLLLAFLEAPGEVLSKSDLAERVWRRDFIEDGNLRVAISALRKLLGRAPDGSEYIVNVVGRGYGFCPSVTLERWPQSSTARARTPRRRVVSSRRLPPLLNPVFGRRHDIELIGDLLANRRFITIVGPGGIGKTTVAIASASLRASAEEAVCFVDLAPIRDPALVPARIATALGAEQSGVDPWGYIAEVLEARAQLLVIDNAEHVAEAASAVVADMLATGPHIRVIVTSREPLGADGETVHRLDPLRLPPAGSTLRAADAMTYDAIELLVDRIHANAPEFVLTDTSAPVATEICRRLDGVPLAIRLAAGRVPAFGLKGVLAHLERRFTLLSQGPRASNARHQTLETAFDWSYELLTLAEQKFLAKMGVFANAFPLSAIGEIVGGTETRDDDMLATLGDLVSKSLVVFIDDDDGGRYRLLEMVRVFALARLEASGEARETMDRHAGYVVARCQDYHAQVSQGRPAVAADLARTTLDDARVALQRSIDDSDWSRAWRLIQAAGPLLTQLGFAREVADWITRILDAESDPERRLALLIALGGALWLSSPEDIRTIEVYGEAYSLANELGDTPAKLRAAWSLILATCSARRPRASIRIAQQLAAGAETQDADKTGHAALLRALAGVSRHLLGDYAACERNIRWLLDNYPADRSTGESGAFLYDPRLIGRPFLAWIECFSGRLADAAATSEMTVVESGDHVASIFNNTLRSAFPIAVDSGRWEAARDHLTRLERYGVDRPSWRPWIDALRDILGVRLDRSSEALQRLEAFVTGGEDFRGFQRQTWYYVQLVRAYLIFGRYEAAETLLKALITFVETEEENWWRPELVMLEACILGRNDAEASHARYLEAAVIARGEGSLLIELRAALGARRATRDPHRRADAGRLVGEAVQRLMASAPGATGSENRRLLRHVLLSCSKLQRAVAKAPAFQHEAEPSRPM